MKSGPRYAALYRHAQVDLYGRSFAVRCLLQLLVVAYLLTVLIHPRKHVSTGAGDALLYQSPEGLLMTLSAPFPPALLSLHFWAAVLLVGACLLQKHVAMALWDKWSTTRRPQGKGVSHTPTLFLSRRYSDGDLRSMHRNLGYLTLAFIVLMALGGYLLQDRSTFRNVESVMLLFVAPWGVFVVGMLITISYDLWLAHAILGDTIFKASCIAVPLTRVLTAFLQSPPAPLLDVVVMFVGAFEMDGKGPTSGMMHDGGVSLDTAYYVAIGVASVVVGVWQSAELIGLALVSH